jgi:hypothetical protein
MKRSTFVAAPLVVAAVIAVPLLSGCGEEMPNGPRVPTFPVVGQIVVDGKPPDYLAVNLEPQFDKPGVIPASSAFTDKEGKFAISTFETGDGAPPGKYKLTFQWGQINLLNGQYGGPDKLKGRYKKAADSKHEITVTDQKIDLGTIELTTK